MRVETRLFGILSALFFLFAIAYGVWAWIDSGRVEVIGLTALILTGGLAFIVGSYFWFIARRIEMRQFVATKVQAR
jgi:hypothetical protein